MYKLEKAFGCDGSSLTLLTKKPGHDKQIWIYLVEADSLDAALDICRDHTVEVDGTRYRGEKPCQPTKLWYCYAVTRDECQFNTALGVWMIPIIWRFDE